MKALQQHINENSTKPQLKKVQKLIDEIIKLNGIINDLEKIEFRNSAETKELEKAEAKILKIDEELNRYCIKINISENKLFSIKNVLSVLDGINFEEYMSNY